VPRWPMIEGDREVVGPSGSSWSTPELSECPCRSDMWSAEGTLAATLCWPAAWYTSARVCPGLVVPRLVPMAVEWGWALARRALVASAEAVAGSVVVALEPELVEVLLLLLPGCPRPFQVGRGPARCGWSPGCAHAHAYGGAPACLRHVLQGVLDVRSPGCAHAHAYGGDAACLPDVRQCVRADRWPGFL